MQIIDTHAHLDQIENIDEALSQAYDAGVESVIAVGIDLISNQKNLKLKAQSSQPTTHSPQPKIFVALGIHPEVVHKEDVEASLGFINKNFSQAVAIGEIGLDYWYPWIKKSEAEKEKIQKVYRQQLEIAKANNLPVIIHSRGAWRDCLDIAKDVGVEHANFHWYSGPLDILDEILSLGFFISCTPSLAYSPQAQEAIKRAPIEQTLIETDSPVYFKDADGKNGFRATPKDVAKTLTLYSRLKNISEENAAAILTQNAKKFFHLP